MYRGLRHDTPGALIAGLVTLVWLGLLVWISLSLINGSVAENTGIIILVVVGIINLWMFYRIFTKPFRPASLVMWSVFALLTAGVIASYLDIQPFSDIKESITDWINGMIN
jgi:hypothetical protein